MKIPAALPALLMTLFSAAALAQSGETKIIHAGTLLSLPGEAPRQRQSIVIDNGEIIDVRDGLISGAEFDPPAEIIDLSDSFVLPGLMDMHVHLTSQRPRPDLLETSDADFAIAGVGNARTTLLAGFTTVRDVGASSAEAIMAVRDGIEAGTIDGPRVLAAGESISATAGHGDSRGYRRDIAEVTLSSAMCDGADDCRRAVRAQYKLGADVIKVHATGGGADPNGKQHSAPEMFDDELRAVAETAHALGLKVTAHAHGTAGIKAALRAGIDSIEHSSYLDDEAIALYLETGAYMISTYYLHDYFLSRASMPESVHQTRRENMAIQRPMLEKAIRSGVNMAMGTDAGVMPHGDNARNISKYVELGLSPMDAIRTATINAAELMEIDENLGSIEIGKQADIIAVAGSPLDDITELHDVSFVMKGGRIRRSGEWSLAQFPARQCRIHAAGRISRHRW
jgi:imidazolonepropionase-like amidohydrolase